MASPTGVRIPQLAFHIMTISRSIELLFNLYEYSVWRTHDRPRLLLCTRLVELSILDTGILTDEEVKFLNKVFYAVIDHDNKNKLLLTAIYTKNCEINPSTNSILDLKVAKSVEIKYYFE